MTKEDVIMTKGDVIASRRRGNLGGRVLLEIASSLMLLAMTGREKGASQ